MKFATRANEACRKFLAARGYEILDEDYSCDAGEIDFVAKDDDAIVFVEVNAREDGTKGFPTESTSETKRKRLEKIAIDWLAKSDTVGKPIRFDVIALVVLGADRALVRHHINALGACA